jgi:hypothetical protein
MLHRPVESAVVCRPSDDRKHQPCISFSQTAHQRSNQGASRLKYQVVASESAASNA